MTSNYESDPRVPPAHVEKLGKHRRADPHGPVGLPSGEEPVAVVPDPGPSYDDFLEHDGETGTLPDKTG